MREPLTVRILGSTIRLAAAALVAAAAGLALPSAPAGAATCTSAHGVSVVVDFHQLGGGAQTACVADGAGRSASSLFTTAGFPLTYVQRQPGFVCRVSGKPASDPCVNTPPADAYWGLFWSDGKSGAWTYATTSAGSLKVPDGGSVAFSWNGSSARSAPGVAPTAHAAAPTKAPTPKPSSTPSSKPKPKPTPASSASSPSAPRPKSPTAASASATAPGSPGTSTPSPTTPSASTSSEAPGTAGRPTKSPGGTGGEMLPETASPSSAALASDPTDPAASDGGLPTWVGPVVVVGLFAAGATVAVVRRRRPSSP